MTRTVPDFARVSSLAAAQQAARTWLFDHALPFWGGAGHEGALRGACEHLRLDGTNAHAPFKRMRVQARQIYVFSHAAVLGWAEGEALARSGYAFVTRRGAAPGGGWVRRLSPDGETVLDPTVDLYDQAFVLLALAWYAKMSGEEEPLQRARQTVAWLREAMAVPGGGFHNVLPHEPGPRQQNPHMHLLEAALALFDVTDEPAYLGLAHNLVDLFQTRMLDRATGALAESYQADWTPAPGAHVEPGHQYEWVWLLDRYEALTGRYAWPDAMRLFDFARSFGTDPHTGLVQDSVALDGSALQRSTRLWPQTEALKAYGVMMRRGLGDAVPVVQAVRTIGTRFLSDCPPGTWVDHLDAAGQPVVDKIPTSSLYHLFVAFTELDALAPPVTA